MRPDDPMDVGGFDHRGSKTKGKGKDSKGKGANPKKNTRDDRAKRHAQAATSTCCVRRLQSTLLRGLCARRVRTITAKTPQTEQGS
eukprot:1999960-Amphidinium_carterae.1